MLTESKSINGVDTQQLMDTVNALKEKPDLARCQFRARNKWIYGGHNITRIGDFYSAGEERHHLHPFTHEEDEPPLLLGEDQGANPVEYLLSALAGCITTSLIYNAAARGIEISEVESELEGDLDLRGFLGISPEVRNGYSNIRVNFKIKSDAPRQQLEELMQVARERSPVMDMVTHGVPIEVRLQNKL
jgi:uncharacterized OsmC-like protein